MRSALRQSRRSSIETEVWYGKKHYKHDRYMWHTLELFLYVCWSIKSNLHIFIYYKIHCWSVCWYSYKNIRTDFLRCFDKLLMIVCEQLFKVFSTVWNLMFCSLYKSNLRIKTILMINKMWLNVIQLNILWRLKEWPS
jgi:hypothetical protein